MMIWNRAWTEEHKVVQRFGEAMLEEIDSNMMKGDREQWSKVSIDELLGEIDHHKAKLVDALKRLDFAKIREHSADVANISMMIADNAGVLGDDSPRFALVREEQRKQEKEEKAKEPTVVLPEYSHGYASS